MRSRSCALKTTRCSSAHEAGWLTRRGPTVRRRTRGHFGSARRLGRAPKLRSSGGHLFATLATGAGDHVLKGLAMARPGMSGPIVHRLGLHAKLERSGRRGVLAGRGCAASGQATASGLGRSGQANRFSIFFVGRPVGGRSRAWLSLLGASAQYGRNQAPLDHDREALKPPRPRRRRSKGAAVGVLVASGRRRRRHYPRSRRRSPRSPRSRRGGRPPPSKRSSASPSARGISLPVA